MRIRKSLAAACALALAFSIGAPSLAFARTGSVRVQIYKAGFIVGVQGGKGALTFVHRVYPLSIGGIGQYGDNFANPTFSGTCLLLVFPADEAQRSLILDELGPNIRTDPAGA